MFELEIRSEFIAFARQSRLFRPQRFPTLMAQFSAALCPPPNGRMVMPDNNIPSITRSERLLLLVTVGMGEDLASL